MDLTKTAFERHEKHGDYVMSVGSGTTVCRGPFAEKIDDGYNDVIHSRRVASEEPTTSRRGEVVRRVWVVPGVGWVGGLRFDPHQNRPKSQFTFKPLLLFTIEEMRYSETTIGKP